MRSLQRLDRAEVRTLMLHGLHAEASARLQAAEVNAAWLEGIDRGFQYGAITLHAMLVLLTTSPGRYLTFRNSDSHLVGILGFFTLLDLDYFQHYLLLFLLGSLVNWLALCQE